MPGRAPTRQLLLDAGMRLFAERGFDSVSVGDIESAVGLQPRRGALYKHFRSKRDLLEAAVSKYLEDAATIAGQIADLDLSSISGVDRPALRDFVIQLGRWFLDEMDRLEDLTRLLEHDGRSMPDRTREVKERIVDLSYRTATRLIEAVAPDVEDAEAIAVLLLGSLVALRRTAWTFGSPPLGIEDDRSLDAWADMTLARLSFEDGGR